MCHSIFKRKTEFPLEFSVLASQGWGEAGNRLLLSPWSQIPQSGVPHPPVSELAYRASATEKHCGVMAHTDKMRDYAEQLTDCVRLGDTN